MSIPLAHCAFTWADAARDYSSTHAELQTATTEELQREYLQAMKDGFNPLFGHNARQFGNLVVDELTRRDELTVPNMFGAITVRPFRK